MSIEPFSMVLLLCLVAAGWFWYSGLGARERALSEARQACRREGVQMLDDSVACVRWRVARSESGRLGILRAFVFDYSTSGTDRLSGSVILLDHELMLLHLPPPQDGGAAAGSCVRQ